MKETKQLSPPPRKPSPALKPEVPEYNLLRPVVLAGIGVTRKNPFAVRRCQVSIASLSCPL